MNRHLNGGDPGPPPGGATQAALLEDKLRAFYFEHVPPGAPRPEPRLVIEHFPSPQALNDALLKKYGASLELANADEIQNGTNENWTGHGLGAPAVIQGAGGERRSGWMHKKGGVGPGYKKRFFVFEKGQLSWHKTEFTEDDDRWGTVHRAKGTISCVGAVVEPNTGEEKGLFKFDVNPSEGTTVRCIHLACESAADRDEWVGLVRRYGSESNI